MIYLWLKYTQKMLVFETHEEFQNVVSRMIHVNNQDGSTVFVEKNTKQWND